jgi:uncharacterized membrane protein
MATLQFSALILAGILLSANATLALFETFTKEAVSGRVMAFIVLLITSVGIYGVIAQLIK